MNNEIYSNCIELIEKELKELSLSLDRAKNKPNVTKEELTNLERKIELKLNILDTFVGQYVLDTGYVVLDMETDGYLTSNRGIFVTERNAQKLCDRLKKNHHSNYEVAKVAITIISK